MSVARAIVEELVSSLQVSDKADLHPVILSAPSLKDLLEAYVHVHDT